MAHRHFLSEVNPLRFFNKKASHKMRPLLSFARGTHFHFPEIKVEGVISNIAGRKRSLSTFALIERSA